MEETLKMGTLGRGGAARSGWQWLKEIISSPWTHSPPSVFCRSFFPPPSSDSHSLLIRYPPWVLLRTACKFTGEKKRLCKQRGRLKLTGLANKSQTLSYSLRGVCVPFFISHGTGVQTARERLWMEPSKVKRCRTIRKDTLGLKSHPIYYISGELWKPSTWRNWDFENRYTVLKTLNFYRTEISFSFTCISYRSKRYRRVSRKSENGKIADILTASMWSLNGLVNWLDLAMACSFPTTFQENHILLARFYQLRKDLT